MISPLNCREVTTRLALGDIERYGFRDRFMIRFHLIICWVCRKYERQMKVIGRAFSAALEHHRDPEAVSKFKAQLAEKLRKIA